MPTHRLATICLLFIALSVASCDKPPDDDPPRYRSRIRSMNKDLDDALREAQDGNVDEARDKAGLALIRKFMILESMPDILGKDFEDWYVVIADLCFTLDKIQADAPPPTDPAAYGDWLEELRSLLEDAKSDKEQLEAWVTEFYNSLPRVGGIPGPGGVVLVLQDVQAQLAEMNRILARLIEELSVDGADAGSVYRALPELRRLKAESVNVFPAARDMDLSDWVDGMRHLDAALDSIISFKADDPPTDDQLTELQRRIRAAKEAKKVVE
jgi:hypothetical protein